MGKFAEKRTMDEIKAIFKYAVERGMVIRFMEKKPNTLSYSSAIQVAKDEGPSDWYREAYRKLESAGYNYNEGLHKELQEFVESVESEQ